MIIPFLSRYRQQFHYEKYYWLTRQERRRAFLFVCGITFCITLSVILWLLK